MKWKTDWGSGKRPRKSCRCSKWKCQEGTGWEHSQVQREHQLGKSLSKIHRCQPITYLWLCGRSCNAQNIYLYLARGYPSKTESLLFYYEFSWQGILWKVHGLHLPLSGTCVFDGTFRLLARSWLPGLSSMMSPVEWTSMMFFRMSRLVRFFCAITKDSRGFRTPRQNGGYAALTLQRPNVLLLPAESCREESSWQIKSHKRSARGCYKDYIWLSIWEGATTVLRGATCHWTQCSCFSRLGFHWATLSHEVLPSSGHYVPSSLSFSAVMQIRCHWA